MTPGEASRAPLTGSYPHQHPGTDLDARDRELGYGAALEFQSVEWLAAEVRLQHYRRVTATREERERTQQIRRFALAAQRAGEHLLRDSVRKDDLRELARALYFSDTERLNAWSKARGETR